MWAEFNNNTLRPIEDVTAKMMALEGELGYEQAQATLAEFLYHNPAFLMDIIAGVKMFPMQELIIKGWMQNDYNLGVWGRGVSKSWTVALFAALWGVFKPNTKIVIVSFSFRASRRILEQIEKFVNDKEASMLKACFPDKMMRKTDEWVWKLPNGTTITCLPLGDGKKIRGVRADLLIVDEFAYLPETVIGEVLRPFLTANNKIKEQLANKEREDKAIARGEMTEDQRTIIEDRKKVIFLSSACYQFEHMYKRYCDWVGLLTAPEKREEMNESGMSYFVSRLSYEAAPEGLLNLKEIDEAKRDASDSLFDREYRALFTGDSSGFFRASKMMTCSIKDGETPCLELVGEKTARYVLGIDQSLSGSESSDHFAICVMKIIKKDDGKEIGMVVHSYAVAGGNLKDHILYLFFLIRNFNVVYIALDATQGDELEFVSSANQSKLFQDHKIELLPIDAEFRSEDFSEIPKQIKKSYNLTAGRIVQKQPFSSAFQRRANEYLQASFDHSWIRFGGKIAANSGVASKAANTNLSVLLSHEEFKPDKAEDGVSAMQFIDEQDRLLDLTRNECAMIQVKATDGGTLQFGLPQVLRRTTGPNKMRKDSYSALLLCNWAVKMYLDSLAVEEHKGPIDIPYGWA